MVAASIVPSIEQIAELRNIFKRRLQKDEPPGGFHPSDISRIENEDFWLSRFISYNDFNMEKSATQLWDTCVWRKEFGTNDLTADNVRQDYRDSGLYFSRGRDLDGKAIFYFKCRLFIKGSRNIDELKRVLIYWIERTIRENDWDLITPTFDMSGCGLSNVDLSYLQYIISTFKTYYPDQINYIVVYDMAWILNATFQLIKKLLPPKAVERLRFVNTKSIKQLIDENNMPVEWGGKDDYKFHFVPEKVSNNNNSIVTPNKEKIANGNGWNVTDSDEKKVHFAQNLNSPGAPEAANTMAESHLLRVTPSEAIVFNKVDNDLCGQVKIQNIDSTTLTYKIKTTAPEKFRVRPSSGILAKGESVSITVVFNHGQAVSTLSRDKFLVMCMPLAGGIDHDPQHLAELWKTTSSSSANVEQYRLRCNLADGITDTTMKNGKAFDSSFESTTGGNSSQGLQGIQEQIQELRAATRKNQTLQWITMALFILLSIAMVYIIKFEIKNNSYEYCVRQ